MKAAQTGLWTAILIGVYLGAHAVEAPRSLRDPVPPHLVALELAALLLGTAWIARAAAAYSPGAAVCMALAVAAAFSAMATALRWDGSAQSWDAQYALHPCCVASTAVVLGLLAHALTRTCGPQPPQTSTGMTPSSRDSPAFSKKAQSCTD